MNCIILRTGKMLIYVTKRGSEGKKAYTNPYLSCIMCIQHPGNLTQLNDLNYRLLAFVIAGSLHGAMLPHLRCYAPMYTGQQDITLVAYA